MGIRLSFFTQRVHFSKSEDLKYYNCVQLKEIIHTMKNFKKEQRLTFSFNRFLLMHAKTTLLFGDEFVQTSDLLCNVGDVTYIVIFMYVQKVVHNISFYS
jgi:hypothetical protein